MKFACQYPVFNGKEDCPCGKEAVKFVKHFEIFNGMAHSLNIHEILYSSMALCFACSQSTSWMDVIEISEQEFIVLNIMES